MKKSAALSLVLFALLVFTSTLTAYTSAFAPNGVYTPLRPEWIREGDYVTYLYSVTAQGLTGTIHFRVTIQGDSDEYLNDMRLEYFGEQVPPNFSCCFWILDPHLAENSRDSFFMTTEEKVAAFKPEIELVRGLNNKTYEAYRLTFDQINDWGDSSCCNITVWYEKETLIKVKQLQWLEDMNVTLQQIIEDSNIQGLAAASTNTTSTPAKTVTTTIFVTPPQTIVTTTTTITETTTVTGSKTVETTTVTETRNTSDNTAAIPISAGILLAGAVISITLLKRRVGPS